MGCSKHRCTSRRKSIPWHLLHRKGPCVAVHDYGPSVPRRLVCTRQGQRWICLASKCTGEMEGCFLWGLRTQGTGRGDMNEQMNSSVFLKTIWSSLIDSLKPHRYPVTHGPCLFVDKVCSHVCLVSCWCALLSVT